MAKIGRNQICPCGSGNKFKRCHGGPAASISKAGAASPRTNDFDVREAIKRHEALEFQRARQQGYGKPIISTEMMGVRYVAIGSRVAYGPWQTFQDFLLHYLKDILGRGWGKAELAKPEADRHPLFQWLAVLQRLMKEHAVNPDGVNTMPEYGAARAVYGLAYDLYLVDHHVQDERDKLAFQRLIERLKHPDQFLGARHEARAAGMLLRAGFNLNWEDELDRREGGHAEFIATFPQTGRSFWIECKMRQPANDGGSFRFTHLVSAALRKETNLERLIFVELNLPDGHMDSDHQGWPGVAINQLRVLEGQRNASDLPQALVVISNFPEHRQLDRLPTAVGAVLEGFKTQRYRFGELVDLADAIKQREDNPEVEGLWRSMQEHAHIPTTFDGSIYGLEDSHRLILGCSYQLPDGKVGVLEEATVVEQWRRAAAFFRLPTEERMMAYVDLSDVELEAWRKHPETFFGELRTHNPPAKNLIEMYDFFAKGYANTPKDRLLELMASQADIEQLRKMSQPELARHYAYGFTANLKKNGDEPSAPTWYGRLRPRRNREEEK